MTSIVIGGIGNAVAIGIITIGLKIIQDVIGQDRNFTGHRQVILDLKVLMVNRAGLDLADLLGSLVDRVLMVNPVDRDLGDLRVNRVDLPVNRAGLDLADLRENRVDRGLMVNPAGLDLGDLLGSLVDQVEPDLELKYMNLRAKQVDQDLNRKWLEELAEVDLMVNPAAQVDRVDLRANSLRSIPS